MLSYKILDKINCEYGDSFYLLDTKVVESNYNELLTAFRKRYNNTKIAYSYKTNYIPQICSLVNKLGGAAEVVSEMELWLALELKVPVNDIYYNGPYKKEKYLEEALVKGIHVNLDGNYELDIIKKIALKYPEKKFNIGLRCNIDIGQEICSRFGFDVEHGELKDAISFIDKISNVKIEGLHCHLPFRTLESYKKRVEKMKEILDEIYFEELSYISFGGGYMGKIDEKMLEQFTFVPPTFDDYAEQIAGFMNQYFKNKVHVPTLIIEPGSAIVANAMKYVTRVINIKQVRDSFIATLSGSTFQINPSVKDINRPIEIYPCDAEATKTYENLNMGGYTCIESDYLYRGYKGKLGIGDYVVFKNIGSYSVVMKPPFILPDIAIVQINDKEEINVCKDIEKEEDIFRLFKQI